MKVKCDLHIHTALSPCADMDMTPNNIVNMAILNGLDVIAVTDHNTVKNARALKECAKGKSIDVLCGMELTTSEEAHFICLFPNVDSAELFEESLKPYAAYVKNREDIFGCQAYFDKDDNLTGYEDRLLLTPYTCSVYEAVPMVLEKGGIIFPAHVDRDSFSIISVLGTIPEDLRFLAAEISKSITKDAALKKFPYLDQYNIIKSSDAHYLWDISDGSEIEETELGWLLSALDK